MYYLSKIDLSNKYIKKFITLKIKKWDRSIYNKKNNNNNS